MTKKKTNDRLAEYQGEYERWLNELQKYHTGRFDKNYRQYTAYSDTVGTSSKISDPLAPEQVERVIQKLFEREPKFLATAKGKNLPKEISAILASIPEYFWNCPERVQSTGTMRSKLKVWGREFCVTGNLGVETYYNQESETPDTRIIPIEDVIFDPAATLKTSSKYYIRQYVSKDYVEKMRKSETGWNDRVVREVLSQYKEKEKGIKNDPSPNTINRSGDTYQNTVDDILLISCYEGKKVVRILEWEGIVQEFENDILDEDPLDFAMDIEVPKEPYAFSLLDFINGITHAKDLLLNQIVDYGSKALNPPLFVDPNVSSSAISRNSLKNAWKLGGLVFADPRSIDHKSMPTLPSTGFELLNYLQTRAEQSSGIGAYLGGVPNQSSDKTQGTKGGIEALINQAISPVKDRQINIEESIIEPVVNKWIKYAGSLMGKDEIKYILVTGQSPKWVKATRGLITGKITLVDLLEAELITEEESMELTSMLMEQGKDPLAEIIFDVDWVIRVETGSMAEVDTEKEIKAFDTAVEFGTQYGLPLDIKKLWIERAAKAGIKEPESYLLEGGQNGIPGEQGVGEPIPATPQSGKGGGVPPMAGRGMPTSA